MTRRFSFLAVTLVIVGIAAPSFSTAAGPRPFRGRVTAQWDNILAALPPELGGAGVGHFVGGGPVTHMGKTAQAGSLSLAFPDETGNFPGSGTVTITAANGDSLTFDYVGLLYPTTGEGIGTFAFTGGTGRFANVSGGGTFYALIDLSVATAQPMTVVLDGEIRF